MTAKEQAVELTREFFPIVNGGETYNIILSKAKKGALITVAQILKSKIMDERDYKAMNKALATLFHDTYERLAPEFGYATRENTKVFDQNSANGKLMIAVCKVILKSLSPKEGINWQERQAALDFMRGRETKEGKGVNCIDPMFSILGCNQPQGSCKDCSNKEPNQTEAENEGDKFIRDNMALPSYLSLDSFAPSMRFSYDLALKSYLESRKQLIEDIEEFVDERSNRLDSISHLVLLKYLQTLKK